MKNIHHMLPPTHRRFWSVLEDFKKEEIKAGKAWRYEADPFAAQRMQDAERLKRDAKREAVNVRDAKNVGGVKPKPGCNSRMNDWRWQIAPTVDMGSERRREIEDLIRRYHVWNPRGIELKPESREKIVEHLTVLGFRKSHAEEACDWVQDLEEALEWLLIHVPEDDIPNRFLPENYIAGVTVAMSENLDIAYAAKRLNSIGYPVNLCHEVLAQNCYSEDRAAEALMQILLYGRQKSPTGLIVQDLKGSSKSQNNEIWQQEQSSLEAIYGSERFQMVSPHLLKITLDLRDGNGVENLPNIILEVRQPTIYPGSLPYPQTIPTFAVVSDGDKKLPAYVKLSIIRQTAEYAESFKGEPMVYTVAGWLEDEILRITDNPGRLRDLTTATSGIDGRKCFPVGQRRKAGMFCQKRAPIDWVPVSHESLDTIESRTERQEALKQQKMTEMRRKLPAWQLRHDIVKAVNSAQVVIISGETGSGKSTQSVQFVLDDLVQRKLGSVANIICTQPRRISALGLADRVSEERCQRVGEEIGYIIRGESKQSAGTTKITFVTTGVLLRRLQTGDLLTDVSHIFVDEVHERSLDTDFLLILIKRIISRRRDLKIILMSATLDADVFSAYFGGDEVVHRIEIEGRTFPVTDYYLDEVIDSTGFSVRGMLGSRPAGRTDEPSTDSDLNVDGINSSIGAIIRTLGDRINYDLIAATVMHINDQAEDTDGGILIFLPGIYNLAIASNEVQLTLIRRDGNSTLC
jgi:ATP-dependent RNA helicase DHX57